MQSTDIEKAQLIADRRAGKLVKYPLDREDLAQEYLLGYVETGSHIAAYWRMRSYFRDLRYSRDSMGEWHQRTVPHAHLREAVGMMTEGKEDTQQDHADPCSHLPARPTPTKGNRLLRVALDAAMKYLTDRQRQLIQLRGQGMTWEAIGNQIGTTKQGAQRQHRLALRKLTNIVGTPAEARSFARAHLWLHRDNQKCTLNKGKRRAHYGR